MRLALIVGVATAVVVGGVSFADTASRSPAGSAAKTAPKKGRPGPRGPRGPQGPRGADGAAGAPGAQGPAGLSEAITHAEPAAILITAAQDVLSITLPAGSWIVFARMDAANADNSITRLECSMFTPDNTGLDFWKQRLAANDDPNIPLVFGTPTMQGAATLTAGGAVRVACTSTVGRIELISRQITAVRVGKLTTQ